MRMRTEEQHVEREKLPRVLAPAAVVLMLAGCVPEPDSTPASSSSASSSATAQPRATPTSTPTGTPAPSPTPDARTVVDVTIVTLDVIDDELEATAIVPGVIENGGTCTLTITNGDDKSIATTSGTAGPESTNCGLMNIDARQLSAGDWNAVIDYSSETSRGTSENQVVEVR